MNFKKLVKVVLSKGHRTRQKKKFEKKARGVDKTEGGL